MKKALVLNTLKASIDDVSCCNILKKENWYKSTLSSKQYQEQTITEKFNKISSKGFVFQDGKVLSHNLFVENKYEETSLHGVYRFTNGANAKYQIYFGPVIEISLEDFGCLTGFGCNPSSLGCNPSSLGCSPSSLGCSSKGGNKQYVNFFNNEKNQKDVQALNKHYGLREKFDREKDDYIYSTITGTVSFSELVKDHYEKILSQYSRDVEQLYQQGLCYIETIDTPSSEGLFKQAMLFGSTSNRKVEMTDLSSFQATVRLSRFDVWYFSKSKGLLLKILEKIPLIGSIVSMFSGGEEEEIEATSVLCDSNVEIVEKTYEEDFNACEDKEVVAHIAEASIVGKIPVTFAVKRKLGLLERIFHAEEYDFHTYLIDAIE